MKEKFLNELDNAAKELYIEADNITTHIVDARLNDEEDALTIAENYFAMEKYLVDTMQFLSCLYEAIDEFKELDYKYNTVVKMFENNCRFCKNHKSILNGCNKETACNWEFNFKTCERKVKNV